VFKVAKFDTWYNSTTVHVGCLQRMQSDVIVGTWNKCWVRCRVLAGELFLYTIPVVALGVEGVSSAVALAVIYSHYTHLPPGSTETREQKRGDPSLQMVGGFETPRLPSGRACLQKVAACFLVTSNENSSTAIQQSSGITLPSSISGIDETPSISLKKFESKQPV